MKPKDTKLTYSPPHPRRRVWRTLLLLGLAALIIYLVPPVHSRANNALANLRVKVAHLLAPPEKVVFVPQTPTASSTPVITPSLVPSSTPTLPGPSSTPTRTPTPSLTASPIPPKLTLVGATHEYQKWNNCGPATLAEALTFWGWQGDQTLTAAWIKPNPRDKNVGPYELADYVLTQTEFKALVRMGGDLELLKKLLAAGFPVIVEKGFEIPGEDWMGHYTLLTGYDDRRIKFVAQDVYIMADFPEPYDELQEYWQHFNYVYVLVYPADREAQVQSLLGANWDATANFRAAAELAQGEIVRLSGREEYFAWYNLGSSLVYLQDYANAAAAFDQAFTLYSQIAEDKRPWRQLWYQPGPYEAYYVMGRYAEVVTLATNMLRSSVEPALEEGFYWRGRAYVALGETDKAIADFRSCLKWHPGYLPALSELQTLGVAP
jgi:hypothetical protein